MAYITSSQNEVRKMKTIGSFNAKTYQGDTVVKSAKAWFSRRRSRIIFDFLSIAAVRLGGVRSYIL